MIDDNGRFVKKNWRFCQSVIITIRFTELFSKNWPNAWIQVQSWTRKVYYAEIPFLSVYKSPGVNHNPFSRT